MASADTRPRRARRAVPPRSTLTTPILLSQPDRSGPKGKTLLELASERQASPRSRGNANTPPSVAPNALSTPSSTHDILLTTLLHALTLSALHTTLALLVLHQYSQTPPSASILPSLVREAATRTLPALFLLVYPLHTRTALRFPVGRQVLFFAAGVAAGAHLIWVGNKGAYLAVMRRAPGAATVAVWCVVESGWEWSVVGVGLVGGWAWWHGLGMF